MKKERSTATLLLYCFPKPHHRHQPSVPPRALRPRRRANRAFLSSSASPVSSCLRLPPLSIRLPPLSSSSILFPPLPSSSLLYNKE